MKKFLITATLVAVGALAVPAGAADVGVSISVGQPGFYGRIDIGGYPSPQVIYRQPMMIERVYHNHPPIYLRVPRGHAKHWHRHCGKYNACGERVMFVQNGWYNREYVPRYREQHRGNDLHHDHRGKKH